MSECDITSLFWLISCIRPITSQPGSFVFIRFRVHDKIFRIVCFPICWTSWKIGRITKRIQLIGKHLHTQKSFQKRGLDDRFWTLWYCHHRLQFPGCCSGRRLLSCQCIFYRIVFENSTYNRFWQQLLGCLNNSLKYSGKSQYLVKKSCKISKFPGENEKYFSTQIKVWNRSST